MKNRIGNWLYLIPFLHQTTTTRISPFLKRSLYLIPFLHQTTTHIRRGIAEASCILFHFYIKPQLLASMDVFQVVVSYSISTSNHNKRDEISILIELYLIPFLHQTTTTSTLTQPGIKLYLIPFLHQTTTAGFRLLLPLLLYLIPFLHQTTTVR